MGFLKYFGERGGVETQHGGQLHWPGTPAGFPFRGSSAPTLTDEERDELPVSIDFHCRVFELWQEEDEKEYKDIRDRGANGWYQIVHIERLYDEERKNWRVYLEWHQVYGELPNGKSPQYTGPTRADSVSETVKL